ncbi:hypothetical protein DSL72_000702 [Monilinia vaccinii-corymbosi]|uniref:Uncharacterized protein n=1 Tax=Monilinia vaccinii-corymbosi TaxID=61207 RepID=A0A8A3P9Q2_9HELO|nr:hypothetical protein DSL72_000702 [Monilinia vaccinii-corymbosi]
MFIVISRPDIHTIRNKPLLPAFDWIQSAVHASEMAGLLLSTGSRNAIDTGLVALPVSCRLFSEHCHKHLGSNNAPLEIQAPKNSMRYSGPKYRTKAGGHSFDS